MRISSESGGGDIASPRDLVGHRALRGERVAVPDSESAVFSEGTD